jgi:membrane-bound lytic murein transglycosylase D
MKTMLKSLVPVSFCSLMLFMAKPAAANSGQLSLEPPKSVRSDAGKSNLSFYTKEDVSAIQPGRQGRGFIKAYLKENDESLALIRQRSKRPFTIIDSVLGCYDLPAELKYLAVIESELKATAVSRVGARGPWQLMAVTARDLGLKVNGRSDERTNYYKSTKAAALYLRDLHREFGDWLLVLAAYNAGPVPVNRAIRLAHSRNFWALQRYLPAESRQHVKRFLATAWYFNLNELKDSPTPADLQCGQSGFPGAYACLGGSRGEYAPLGGFQGEFAGLGCRQDLPVERILVHPMETAVYQPESIFIEPLELNKNRITSYFAGKC